MRDINWILIVELLVNYMYWIYTCVWIADIIYDIEFNKTRTLHPTSDKKNNKAEQR